MWRTGQRGLAGSLLSFSTKGGSVNTPELIIYYEPRTQQYAIAVRHGADRITIRHEAHHQDAIQIANGIRAWTGLRLMDRTTQ